VELTEVQVNTARRGSPLEVFLVFLRLGLTSFGGPVAHLGYFREEIVARRKWLDEAAYADLVALCQFLPGPASSQVGIGIGTARAGMLGGLAAWLGFTTPSAVLLALFAIGIAFVGDPANSPWLHGLKVVAVAVVAQAVWSMATKLAPDRLRATIAILSAVVLLFVNTALMQIAVILVSGLVGWRFLGGGENVGKPMGLTIPRGVAYGSWVLLLGLLIGLPLLRQITPESSLALFDSFFRVGSLVFGGGHVVLPLLQAEVVPPGWMSEAQFIAGYGAAQAVPGPLFTFAAYLGAVSSAGPGGFAGAALAIVAIFLPSFLLLYGVLPFWDGLRQRAGVQAALRGVNAAVVGILLAALYDPVITSAIQEPADVALALLAYGLLVFWKIPPWLVVALTALGGVLLAIV
jgi:chromate transporter